MLATMGRSDITKLWNERAQMTEASSRQKNTFKREKDIIFLLVVLNSVLPLGKCYIAALSWSYFFMSCAHEFWKVEEDIETVITQSKVFASHFIKTKFHVLMIRGIIADEVSQFWHHYHHQKIHVCYSYVLTLNKSVYHSAKKQEPCRYNFKESLFDIFVF